MWVGAMLPRDPSVTSNSYTHRERHKHTQIETHTHTQIDTDRDTQTHTDRDTHTVIWQQKKATNTIIRNKFDFPGEGWSLSQQVAVRFRPHPDPVTPEGGRTLM